MRELQTLVQEGRGGLAQDPTKFGDLVQKSLREKFGNMREWPSSPANRRPMHFALSASACSATSRTKRKKIGEDHTCLDLSEVS